MTGVSTLRNFGMAPKNQEIAVWFEQEIKAYDGKLRSYLSKNESEPADVEDIVQESYCRILKVREKREIRSPSGLLFKIARNVTNDRIRKKYRENVFSVAEIDKVSDLSSGDDSVEHLERSQKLALLESALKSLPQKCRNIMVLRAYENLSYKQIAARLNISVDTVETQLSRALKKCKKHFQKQGYTFK